MESDRANSLTRSKQNCVKKRQKIIKNSIDATCIKKSNYDSPNNSKKLDNTVKNKHLGLNKKDLKKIPKRDNAVNSKKGDVNCSFEDIESKIFSSETQLKIVDKKSSKISPVSLKSSKLKKQHKDVIKRKKFDATVVPEKIISKVIKSQESKPNMKQREMIREEERNKKVKQNKNKSNKGTSSKCKKVSKILKMQNVNHVDSEESDWEEIDELDEIIDAPSTSKGDGDVQIELERGNVLWGIKSKKRMTQEEMIEDYLRREVNKSIREGYENMHKSHLLCLFAHGVYVNKVLTSENLLSSAMSLIPKSYFTPKRFDLGHLEKFVGWFSKSIDYDKQQNNQPSKKLNSDIEKTLADRLSTKSAGNGTEFVLLFVLVARSVGMEVRLVFSFHPISWKPSTKDLIKKKKDDEFDKPTIVDVPENQVKNPFLNKKNMEKKLEKTKELHKKKSKSRKVLSTDSEDEKPTKTKAVKKMKSVKKQSRDIVSSDDEFDHEKEIKFKKKTKAKSKAEVKCTKTSMVNKKNPCIVAWAEVYVEEEEKWIAVDVIRKKIHCASEIQSKYSNLAYIVAYNPNQSVKDVTRRYVSSWLSYKDKIQCDGQWWIESLEGFSGPKSKRDKKEEKELEENLKRQPMPKTIGEYKNHPMYALQRHLLKFEAIYPPDADPIGFIRGEAVFPRKCVVNLHGRENWFKMAKTVIVGEEPYKIVKARPKWDRATCSILSDRPLEIFGEWQTEDYDPPTAKNGKVPRNEYGNVDLFRPCMLPKKCVHLKVPGLMRVARKLHIDCVPATVDFEYSKGGSHPVFDGYVVCEEFKDILMDAWEEDKKIQAEKEIEKRFKRIYGNWKRLINGVFLRERMKEKYGAATSISQLPSEEEQKSILSLAKKENEDKMEKEKSRRKIKQEDISALVPNLITHKVANLKIDFNSTVSERNKRPKRKVSATKPRLKSVPKNLKLDLHPEDKQKEFASSSSKVRDYLSSSGSEDEINPEEKKENIRKILDWNPDGLIVGTGPTLSDDSDRNEESNHDSHVPKPSLLKKKRTKNEPKLRLKKIKKDISDGGNEDIGGTNNKRLSLRRKSQMPKSYKEDPKSESDISLSDSDSADKAYNPAKDLQTKPSMLDLSEESE